MGIYSHPWICRDNCSLCYICHLFQFNTCSKYCFCHRCFVPSPNNAPLPFYSPVKEHLGGWSLTRASVNTVEIIHNLDNRQTHTNTKEPPVRHPRPRDGILSTWLLTTWVKCLNYESGLFRLYVFNEEQSPTESTSEHLAFFSPVVNHMMEYWSICVNHRSFGLQPPTCGASVMFLK